MANLNDILATIPVGFTRVVGPTVVTRWGADVYEVGTWGKRTVGAFDAAATIATWGSAAWPEYKPAPRRHDVGCHPEVAAFLGGQHFVAQVAWGAAREITWTWARTAAAAVEQARALAAPGFDTFVLTAPGRVIEVHDAHGRLVHHTHTLPFVVRRLVAPATAA